MSALAAAALTDTGRNLIEGTGKMMDRRQVLGGAAALPAAAVGPAHADGAASALLGAWSLVEAVTIHPDGRANDWDGHEIPHVGLIAYLPTGWMTVQMAAPRAARDHDTEFTDLPPAERLTYLDTYLGYFGRYEVIEADREVRHHVVSSLDPTEIGTIFRRRFEIEGDRLVLKSLNSKGALPDTYVRGIWTRTKA